MSVLERLRSDGENERQRFREARATLGPLLAEAAARIEQLEAELTIQYQDGHHDGYEKGCTISKEASERYDRIDARIEQLEAALREINQQRYTGRNTINLDNAYEMAIALNAKLLAVMDTARAALEEPHKTLGMRGPHVHSSEQILPLTEASE